MVIGGPGIKVEIGETVMFKGAYNHGRIDRQQWFFGGYCGHQSAGCDSLFQSDPGSIIESNQWLVYRDLSSMA